MHLSLISQALVQILLSIASRHLHPHQQFANLGVTHLPIRFLIISRTRETGWF